MRELLAAHHQQYVVDPIAVDRLLANGQLKVPEGSTERNSRRG